MDRTAELVVAFNKCLPTHSPRRYSIKRWKRRVQDVETKLAESRSCEDAHWVGMVVLNAAAEARSAILRVSSFVQLTGEYHEARVAYHVQRRDLEIAIGALRPHVRTQEQIEGEQRYKDTLAELRAGFLAARPADEREEFARVFDEVLAELQARWEWHHEIAG